MLQLTNSFRTRLKTLIDTAREYFDNNVRARFDRDKKLFNCEADSPVKPKQWSSKLVLPIATNYALRSAAMIYNELSGGGRGEYTLAPVIQNKDTMTLNNMSTLVNQILRQSNYLDILYRACVDMSIYGNAYIKMVYSGEKIKLYNIPPVNILLDPDARTIDTVSYVIESVSLTESDLQEFMESADQRDVEVYTSLREKFDNGETHIQAYLYFSSEGFIALLDTHYNIVALAQNPYNHQHIPIYVLQYLPVTHSPYALSSIDLIADLVKEVNLLTNLRLDNLSLTVNKIITVDDTVPFDPSLIQPGSVLRVPPGSIQPLSFGPLDQSSALEVTQMLQLIDSIASAPMHIGDITRANVTAAAIDTHNAYMRIMTDAVVSRNLYAAIRYMIIDCINLIQQYLLDTEEISYLLPEGLTPETMKNYKVTPETCTIVKTYSTLARSEQLSRINVLLAQAQALGVSDRINRDLLMQEIINALGMSADVLLSPTAPALPSQAMSNTIPTTPPGPVTPNAMTNALSSSVLPSGEGEVK